MNLLATTVSTAVLLFLTTLCVGQTDWDATLTPRFFTRNLGQFDHLHPQEHVHYVSEIDGYTVVFSDHEVTFIHRVPLYSHKEIRRKKRAMYYHEIEPVALYREERFRIRFQESAVPVTEEAERLEFTHHFTYQGATVQATTGSKIRYKGMYPGIDVEFTLPENGGIKYDFIVHPGADISAIQVVYPDINAVVADQSGNLLLEAKKRIYTEKNLIAYDQQTGERIRVNYVVSGNTVRYDADLPGEGHDLVIDPWVTTITQPNQLNRAWNLDYDNQGNVIVETMCDPGFAVQVMKFSSTGSLQWIYTTTMVDMGDVCVNPNNNDIYFSEGHAAVNPVVRLSPAGIQTALYPYDPLVDNMEFWRMGWDRCNNQLLLGLGGPMNSNIHGKMNLALSSMDNVVLFPADFVQQDVNYMEMDPNGTAMYGRNSQGKVYKTNLPSLSTVIWDVILLPAFIPENQNLIMTSMMNYTATNGFNGLAANRQFLFEYNGLELVKRNKTTGVQLAQQTIGTVAQGHGGGGLEADLCGNVFVGVHNTIRIYDENLILLNTINLQDTVYDMKLYGSNVMYVSGKNMVAQINLTPYLVNTYTTSTIDAQCNACDGSATVNVCGANAVGYTFLWQPSGQTTQTATNLCPGNHNVFLMYGCDTVHRATVTIDGTISPYNLDLGEDTIICSGTLTLDAGTGAASYLWQDSSANQAYVATASGTYWVTITDTLGCELSDTIEVLVGEIPVDLGPDTAFCDQANLLLDAGWSGSLYTWQDGSSNQQFQVLTAGTFWVSVDSLGCIGSDTVVVTVVSSPVLMVQDESMCVGDTVQLTVSGADSYMWSPATGLSADTGPVVDAFPAMTTIYTVTGTSNGCSDTTTVTVVVHALPQITINPELATVCLYDSIVLTASGADTYTWSPATGLNTVTGAIVSAGPESTLIYTVTGTDTNNCVNAVQKTVTVEEAVVTVNDATVCAGDPNDIESLTASGALTYVWSPGTGLNTTTGSTVQAHPSVTTVYQVIGTTGGGCLDTAQATVTVIPEFTVEVNSDSICSGESTLLTASGAETYSWSPAIGLNATTGIEVMASPNVTTTYTITGTVSGCTETGTAIVTVIPVPDAQATASPNPVSNLDPSVMLFTSNTESDLSWYFNNSLLSHLQHFQHVFPETPGSYTVQLVVKNVLGCTDTATVVVVVQEDIIFYVPNTFTPDGNEYNNVFQPVLTAGIDESGYELRLYDRWGELVFSTTDTKAGWDGTYKGKLCQDGTFTWKMSFKSKYTDQKFEHNGHVTLLR
jgi:gliding motility-associated-like protein